MRTKDVAVIALLLWWLWPPKPQTDVNIVITEPGFEGEEVH